MHVESGERKAQNFEKGRYEEGDAGVIMFPGIPQKFRIENMKEPPRTLIRDGKPKFQGNSGTYYILNGNPINPIRNINHYLYNSSSILSFFL